MTQYLLDTNVFIEAKNRYYGFDFCPAFWDWLVVQNVNGKVASIEKVADELNAGKDKLSEWASDCGDEFFLQADDRVVSKLKKVSAWATQNYESLAAAKFLDGADCWLVAHGLAHEYMIVTHETAKPIQPVGSKRPGEIKIPNACSDLGLPCVSPYQMLRREPTLSPPRAARTCVSP